MTSFFLSSYSFAADKWPESVGQYERTLKEVRLKHTTLEPAFKAGMNALNELSDFLSNDESEIDPNLLKEIKSKMEGFELTPNTESFVGRANFDFFAQLARANKVAEDIAFFELEKKTKPDGIWRIYIHQETDLSGCTVFNGSLTRLHKEWTEFQNKFPKAYVVMAKDQINDIELKLTESNCSCDKKAMPILKELEQFSKENPNSRIIPKIRSRIEQLKAGKKSTPGC